MEKLQQTLEANMNETMVQIIVSNKRQKSSAKKVVIRPFLEQNRLLFQFAEYRENQVFHTNLLKADAVSRILLLLCEDFKQIEILTEKYQITALVSKKGKAAIKSRPYENHKKIQLTHNRPKAYILSENEPIPFLVELGVQTKEGKVVDKKYKKFRQINRYLEFIRDVLPELPKNRTLTILDFGCGKSYLTFAMYYYLKVMNGYDLRVIGLDLKKQVIADCNRLAERLGYEQLQFLEGDIGSYDGVENVDLVVTLHACDTATDFALEKAVRWGAKVILSVPCCQHEMNRQIQSELLQPVFQYGILKERMAALITDGLRASLLEQCGYDVQIMEFIDMEHTPKNLLIRAVKKEKTKERIFDIQEKYSALCDAMQLHGTLERILEWRKDVE